MLYEVIPTKLFRADAGFLTYKSEQKLLPGQIVLIPLGKTTSVGIVKARAKTQKVNFAVKPILEVLYETPLPAHLLKSVFWLNEYYLIPLPLAASLILPQGVDKKRRKKKAETAEISQKLPIIPLNPAQKMALEALESADMPTKLLHGVTGSGKTNIYLKMASERLRAQKSTLLLVPEIALTSQLVQVFEATFGTRATLIHSKQTDAERHLIWEKLLETDEPQVIIGPRSALFAPIHNLGLIIIDEAHEAAYYQENSPKYSALRLASFIAKTEKISCIFGTATPLISDYYLAKTRKSLVTLNQKAKETAVKPKIEVIDLCNKQNFSKNRYFSDQLLATIKTNLEHRRQTLIFHNRRGSSSSTLCTKCGWQALCPTCFLPLTLHSDTFNLVCHACGHTSKIPRCCPNCGSLDIHHKGFGTKLLEAELRKLFKTAKIARFDADNKKHETLNSLYNEVKTGEIDIIIGTQAVARGLDLPLLASVGIVQADAGLFLPDFSAEERTYHLLTQVIGRVGRGHLKEASVFIQTYQPQNPIINFALSSDYDGFYQFLAKKRKKQHFPPFVFMAKISVTMKTEAAALKKIRQIYTTLTKVATSGESISVPTPAFHEHTTSGYTWQIVLKSTSRKRLMILLSQIDPKLKPNITLDPPSLL